MAELMHRCEQLREIDLMQGGPRSRDCDLLDVFLAQAQSPSTSASTRSSLYR